jgi:hypothetical protein
MIRDGKIIKTLGRVLTGNVFSTLQISAPSATTWMNQEAAAQPTVPLPSQTAARTSEFSTA